MLEARHVFLDAERTPVSDDEQRQIEAIALEWMASGVIAYVTPAIMRMIRVLFYLETNEMRLTRTSTDMTMTQTRQVDRLIASGVVERRLCQETGKQVVKTSPNFRTLVQEVSSCPTA